MKIYSILALLTLILTFASIEIEPGKEAVVDL